MRKKAKERHKAKVLRKNPGLIVLSNVLYKRRSRSGPHFTVEEWELIVTKLKGLCGYCGKKRKLTVDHKMPLSKGGSNTIDNIMPACISCNTSKRNKTAEEFVAYKVGSGLFVPAGTRTT